MEIKELPAGYCLLLILDTPDGLVLPKESFLARVIQTSDPLVEPGSSETERFKQDDYVIVDATDSFRFKMNGVLYCIVYTSRILASISL